MAWRKSLCVRSGAWWRAKARNTSKSRSRPMEAALRLISELAEDGDELGLDYLADAIVHAREKARKQ